MGVTLSCLATHSCQSSRHGFAAVGSQPASAQSDYPNRPVRLVVGFTPGSVADITGRVLGNRMGQILGQQVVIENKPGAGSNLAAEHVARSPKDGYTLFLSGSVNANNAAMSPNLPFDIAKDFAPVALVNEVAVILVVHPSTGVNSVQELIALAKVQARRTHLCLDRHRHRAAHVRRAVHAEHRRPGSCTCPTRAARRRRPTWSPAASR